MPDSPEFSLKCLKCKKHVTGKEQGKYFAETTGTIEVQFTLLECPSCGDPYVMKNLWAGNSWGEDSVPSNEQIVLPKPPDDQLDSSVPENVARSHLEATRVYHDSSAYVAAALMCRRTLEVMCLDFKQSKGSLASKLKALRDEGVIENRLYDWADDVLRILGNEAAHEVSDDITPEDAKDALDFTRALIEYLYVFQAAYERFKARRKKLGV